MTARVTADDGLPAGSLVVGVGLDLCEVPRVARALERHGARFVERVFHPGEIRRSKESPAYAEHVAGLFAAKEAAMKALGTGRSRGVLWKDIEVVRAGGPPQLRFHGGAARRAQELLIVKSLVTITHSEALAMAQVILLG